MKIKKMYQGNLPENTVVNTQSDSQTNAYSCDYLNKSLKYSTSETFTGKYWKDGKKIYKRLIDNVTISTGTGIFVNTQILNVENVTKLYGEVVNGSQTHTIPSFYATNVFITAHFENADGFKKIQYDCQGSALTGPAWFEIEYTKTTD